MLGLSFDLKLDEGKLTPESARQAADEEARARDADPMLISWYEAASGRHSPRVECCRDDRPGWLAYAQSRGADLVININDLSYVFVYLRSGIRDSGRGGRQ
jgi:hypothetical protein